MRAIDDLDPRLVFNLRVHLANHEHITQAQLTRIAGQGIADYMTSLHGFPCSRLDEHLGIHWQCQEVAAFMRSSPSLARLYERAKCMRNPSGRCQSVGRTRRLI